MALGTALALAATGAHAATPRKAKAPDPRDARIEALESEVRDLVSEVRAIRTERAAAAAAPAPRPTGSGTVVVGDASGSAGSPDLPKPAATVASASPSGGASILAGKPSIASPDGRFVANLHAVMQFDAADYFQDSAQRSSVDLRRGAAAGDTAHARDLNDGTDFRRARIGIDGKVFGDFEYNVLFDFGGAGAEDAGHIQELWFQYSGFKPFHLKVGAFRPSLGLEDQGSTNGMPFLERPASTDVGASLAAADYREGAQLWATGERWYASGGITARTLGTINTAVSLSSTGTATSAGAVTASGTINPQSYDQSLGFVGRLAYIPFKGEDWLTHVGVHGSYSYQIADALGPDAAAGAARYPVQFQERPELRVDGTRLVSTGGIDASHASTAGVEVAAQKRNLFIQAEYEHYGIERRNSALSDPDFSGWYVEGSWILTGERRKYNLSTFAFDAPPVDHPFDLKQGTWGAWELAMRYSELDLNYHQGQAGLATPADGVRGGDQQIFTAGVDWYLNPILRFVLQYQHVDIDRLSPNPTTFATPVGAQIGQTYDTLAIRSQLAF